MKLSVSRRYKVRITIN